jgi:hypothetical protein
MNPKKRKEADLTSATKKQELSLTALTNQFIEYVSKSTTKEIDLNELANTLSVPKRRLYDITNVLEGTRANRHQRHTKTQ